MFVCPLTVISFELRLVGVTPLRTYLVLRERLVVDVTEVELVRDILVLKIFSFKRSTRLA